MQEENKKPEAQVKVAVSLTHYAVAARYPGSDEPVKAREYIKALKAAETVFAGAEQQFKEGLRQNDWIRMMIHPLIFSNHKKTALPGRDRNEASRRPLWGAPRNAGVFFGSSPNKTV